MKSMQNLGINRKSLTIITAMAFAVLTQTTSAQVGSCRDGMHNVYNKACEQRELDTDMCTTRYEQTPESYWCCCEEGAPIVDCSKLFDAIFGSITSSGSSSASSSSASNAMTVSRALRDSLLEKSELGTEYIKMYYSNVTNMTIFLAKNPKIAIKTAKIFRANMPLLIDLSEGRTVTLSKKKRNNALELLKEYVEISGKNSEIGISAIKVHDDLESGKSLKEFGIQLK